MTFAISRNKPDSVQREYCGLISDVDKWLISLDVPKVERIKRIPNSLVNKAERMKLGDSMEVSIPSGWGEPADQYILTKVNA